MATNEVRPAQDRASGMTMRFNYPADSSVEISYTRFYLFPGGWKEGYDKRTLVLSFNDQCVSTDVVMELKQAADALGIVFADDPTLTVVPVAGPIPLENWRIHSELCAKRLGWRLIHPFGPRVEVPPFELDSFGDCGF